MDTTNNTDVSSTQNNPEPVTQDLVNDLYDKLITLTAGTKYNNTNWLLLANKAFTLVTSKNMKTVTQLSVDQRINLVCLITLQYLDENTNMSDELLYVIRGNINTIVQKWVDTFKQNAKSHKKVTKKQVQLQKQVAKNNADTVAENIITPARIEEVLITRIEMLIRKGSLFDFESLQKQLPEIVVMSITIVDKYGHLSNVEKRNLIVQTISFVLSEKVEEWFEISESQKRNLELLSDVLPTLVETTTSLVNGEIPDKLNLHEFIPFGRMCLQQLSKLCGNCSRRH